MTHIWGNLMKELFSSMWAELREPTRMVKHPGLSYTGKVFLGKLIDPEGTREGS